MKETHGLCILLIFTLSALLGIFLLARTHITLNASTSLPYAAFFCIKSLHPKRGDLVCLKGHACIYPAPSHMTKRLLGMAGDRIHLRGGVLFVGRRRVGTLRKTTREGLPLTPLRTEVIPEGFVFLGGSHPDSFDSRYEEFGLVPETVIQGTCFGLGRK